MQTIQCLNAYFNPCAYANRLRCWRRFSDSISQQQGRIWTIEATLKGTEFQLPDGDDVLRVRMPESGWVWQKERLLMTLIRQLPDSVEYVAWVDGDILFHDADWMDKAVEQLQDNCVVQLFDHVYWLGPDDIPIPWKTTGSKRPGLAFVANEVPRLAQDFQIVSPGFAWAARREFFDEVGLYENDITGGNDTFMAMGFFGWFDHPFWQHVASGLQADAMKYCRRAYEYVQGKVGYVDAPISHLWHGAYSDRGYLAKQKRLAELGYNPRGHLTTDPETGLLCWSEWAPPELREYLVEYFHSRNEDSTDMQSRADG